MPASGKVVTVPACGAVIAMALCATILIASDFMPVSLLTPIARDLAITEGHAGQSISISGFFALVTGLFILAFVWQWRSLPALPPEKATIRARAVFALLKHRGFASAWSQYRCSSLANSRSSPICARFLIL